MALSAVVAAVFLYGLSPLAWLLEPLRMRLRVRPARPVRVEAATEP